MQQALLIEEDRRTVIKWPEERERWEKSEGILWLDVQGASAEELQELEKAFGLHPVVVRALSHPEHRSRIKETKEHVLLVLNAVGKVAAEHENGHTRVLNAAIGRWKAHELNVVVGRRLLLTVHPDSLPALGILFTRTAKEGEGKPTLEYMLFSIIEAVMTGYHVLLDRLDRYMDDVETMIFQGQVGHEVVDRLFSLKRHLLYLRRVLGPQRDAIGALQRREFPVLRMAEGRPYFSDVYEHTLRLFDLIDTYRDLITSSLDAYLSTVSNRMNEIMKLLTIVSTIMLPLTVITGIFGMNFENMPWLHSPWGFWASMVAMAGICGGMVYYFKRRGWL